MLFTTRAIRILFEGVEDAGFAREDLTRPLGLDPVALLASGRGVEWVTMAALGTQLSVLFDHDPERLRAFGRRLVLTGKPLRSLRIIAKSVVSTRALYEMSVRWVFSTILPHLKLSLRFLSPTRMAMRCEIPEPHAENRAFFPVFEGAVHAMPELIGYPPATTVERVVTKRTLDLVIDHHGKPSLASRTRRTLDALLRAPTTFAALEAQRQELSENIRALQNARDELRVVLERLPDFVAIHANGLVLWANRALTTGLGYSEASELIGRPILEMIAPAHRERAKALVEGPLDATDTAALTECVIRAKNGQDLTVELAPTQCVVFDGINARLIVGRDVTERARMQQKLIVADRLASVGLLAAGVAHEVNNPLGYILNNIELASKDVASDEGAAERRRKVLATALEGVDRIRVIVRDLLMLSRGDDGPLAPIDVGAVAASTLALAAPEIERSACLSCEFEAAPLVVASGARISQVLLNLVGNALEAMSGRPRSANRLVVRIGRAGSDRLALEVADTGNGIAEGNVARVFEPFFTTKPAGRGTGLGLAIAQKIVVEMGGEISVVSKVGQGTTFRVLLPTVTSQPATQGIDAAPRECLQP